jgi:hypothetical protein
MSPLQVQEVKTAFEMIAIHAGALFQFHVRSVENDPFIFNKEELVRQLGNELTRLSEAMRGEFK